MERENAPGPSGARAQHGKQLATATNLISSTGPRKPRSRDRPRGGPGGPGSCGLWQVGPRSRHQDAVTDWGWGVTTDDEPELQWQEATVPQLSTPEVSAQRLPLTACPWARLARPPRSKHAAI